MAEQQQQTCLGAYSAGSSDSWSPFLPQLTALGELFQGGPDLGHV